MKTSTKCAIAAVVFGAAVAGGFAALLPGAHPLIYLGVFVIVSGGGFQGALNATANKKAVDS